MNSTADYSSLTIPARPGVGVGRLQARSEVQTLRTFSAFSILIFMALKNSKTGSLPVSEIYNFMTEHFPYFKVSPKSTAPHQPQASQASPEPEDSVGRWEMSLSESQERVCPPHAPPCLHFRRTVLCEEERAQAIHQRSHSRLESDLMLVEGGHGNSDRLQGASTYPKWGERAWEEMRGCSRRCPQDAVGLEELG